jgi:hypothetical protein
VPGAIQTVVAGTAHAAQTQTAERLPPSATASLTPTATLTASPTPSLTPTFIFSLRSPVPTRTNTPEGGSTSAPVSGSGAHACRLISQDPKDNTTLKSNARFDMKWELQNAGTATWISDDVDFEYVSGRKMHDKDVYDLPHDVAPGETISMTVSMNAPKLAGDWKTVWTLRYGSNDFCHVDVTIVVE